MAKMAKKKPGRPKGKPLSAKERAQRRAAPVKTGEHCETPLAQTLRPCKRKGCPVAKFPCDTKKQVEESGGALSVCLPQLLTETDTQQLFLSALDGNLDGLRPLVAAGMADQYSMLAAAVADVKEHGVVVSKPVVIDDKLVGYTRVHNTAADFGLRAAAQLGLTAKQQLLTPQARGQKEQGDQFISVLGLVGRGEEDDS